MTLCALLLFTITSAARVLRPDYVTVALCLAVRDEHQYIEEWIRYHLAIGVQKIFMYDNNSTPPLATTLMPYLKTEQVEYHYLVASGVQHPQFHIYNRCLEQHRHKVSPAAASASQHVNTRA